MALLRGLLRGLELLQESARNEHRASRIAQRSSRNEYRG
jgi:hypothetical protein